MLFNFITDINNSKLIDNINIFYKALLIKYNSGNSVKNIYHYLHFEAEYSNFNIFYGYINNLLLNTSNNNIFIYLPDLFSTNWISQLNLYNYILVFDKEHLDLEYFQNHKTYFIDFYNNDISYFYNSIFTFFKNIDTFKIPSSFLLHTSNLPNVSICILTYNRPFFIKLLQYHIDNINYPSNKFEIIIIDDGDNNIKHLLPKLNNIKYFKYNNKNTISWKRNQAIKMSSYDIIAFMDDDDLYPPDSLIYRVSHLINSNKQCIFCSTIGCFHIYNDSSIIHSTSIFDSLENKVSEATLTFYKTFWIQKNFNNNDKFNEGKFFIQNRTHLCKDVSFSNIIIQLIHKSNTISKNIINYNKNGFIFYNDKNIINLIFSLK